MSEPDALFTPEAKYAIDSNIVLGILKTADDEHYGVDVFGPRWQSRATSS